MSSEQPNIRQKWLDRLVEDKFRSSGDWDFLARDVPVKKGDYDVSRYDVVSLDLQNRRIKVEVIGYKPQMQEFLTSAVSELDNTYSYLIGQNNPVSGFDGGFPDPIHGRVAWNEEDSWVTDTTEFDEVSQAIFGYDILEADYERIGVDSL